MVRESDAAIFLLGLAVLLGAARLLGELARRFRFPAVAGELTAGVLLGPTVLGRLVPGAVRWLFPRGAPAAMLSGYTLLSAVLLLTVAGLEIDLSVVFKRRREAALTSFAGVALPLALGVTLGLLLPAHMLVNPERRWLFALFMGTALSISAMPVIAKTLLDLGLYRTDLGLLVMAAAMVDDLAGWLMFSLLVGPLHGHTASWGRFALRITGVLAYVGAVLGVGRWFFNRALGALQRHRMSAAGRVLSLLTVLAVLGAAITQWIGVHAVFGAFIVGVAVGDSPRLRAETRTTVHEFVSNVFAPVFFAAVGLRVDFVAAFNGPLVAAVVGIACVAKVTGCTLGARTGGLSWRQAWGVGFAMNSRGAMEIIFALVALEAGLIHPPIFVALVIMALVTSLMAGPAMSRLLRQQRSTDVVELLEQGAVILELRARTPEAAIREMAQALAGGTAVDAGALTEAVLEGHANALGGLSDGVAVPHARVDGIARPMLAFARAPEGLDFDALDGEPARLVFLLFIPERAAARGAEIHAALVACVVNPARRAELLAADSRAAILEVLRAARRDVVVARTSSPDSG